jgi:replicative DNA helicase
MSDEAPTIIQPISDLEPLPFDSNKQEAVLGHLLQDKTFFLQARKNIKYHWFADATMGTVWEVLLKFYADNHRTPSNVEEFKGEFTKYSGAETTVYYQTIDRCIYMATRFGLDIVQRQCTLWLKSILVKEAALNIEYYYGRREIEQCLTYVDGKLAEIKRANFFPDRTVSFLNTKEEIVEADAQKTQNACTTGVSEFDRAILNGNKEDGGLRIGDLTVVMAPISMGKTSFMTTVAVHNIMRGKDVLFLVHEDHPDNIRRRILMCALRCPERDLLDWYHDPEKFGLIQEIEQKLSKHLTYIHIDKPGGTFVEDVVDLVLEKQLDHQQQKGKGFDLLMDDYPGKLLTKERKKEDYRIQMHFIYSQFASLAANLDLHALVAVQSNRIGSTVNREGERPNYMEDVSEAWGIPQIASNFITINRTDEDQRKGIIHYYVDKCRNNKRGVVVTCNSKFDCYLTHAQDLGGIHVESEWSNSATKRDMLTANGGVDQNGKTVKTNGSSDLTKPTGFATLPVPGPDATSDEKIAYLKAKNAAIAEGFDTKPKPPEEAPSPAPVSGVAKPEEV